MLSGSPGPDDRWLRRVERLLAKAQSTDYEAEAEACIAKAQALMARHAIDEAMVQTARQDPGGIEAHDILVEPPYASARSALLGAVARANRCRLVLTRSGRGASRGVLVGHRSDLRSTETLFAVLSLHATSVMAREPVPPTEGPRRFRHAFLLAFAARIGERLRAVAADAACDGERVSASGAAVVLADREAAVNRAVADRFGPLRSARREASSSTGVRSGRAAADSAPLHTQRLAARAAVGPTQPTAGDPR